MPDSPDRPTDDTLETQMPGDERPLLRDLLTRAHEMGLANVKTECLSISDAPERRAVFKAIVTMLADHGTADFVGHGDSDETNTPTYRTQLHPHGRDPRHRSSVALGDQRRAHQHGRDAQLRRLHRRSRFR